MAESLLYTLLHSWVRIMWGSGVFVNHQRESRDGVRSAGETDGWTNLSTSPSLAGRRWCSSWLYLRLLSFIWLPVESISCLHWRSCDFPRHVHCQPSFCPISRLSCLTTPFSPNFASSFFLQSILLPTNLTFQSQTFVLTSIIIP